MNIDSFIRKIVSREEESGCYNVYIDDIPAYRLIRLFVRLEALKSAGYNTMNIKGKRDFKGLLFSSCISFFHILKMFLFRKKYENIFFSFPRIDLVNGFYIDKFTDPVIELCEIDNYIIFDHGIGGKHRRPRLHQEKIVYIDIVHIVSSLYVKLFYNIFKKKYKKELFILKNAIDDIIQCDWDEKSMLKMVMESYVTIQLFSFIFKKIGAKRVLGPSRGQLVHKFIAAKRVGMKTYEFQHGITYSESAGLSGREVPEVEPDVFFAFGDNNPNNVYGISPKKMVNIGWAFQDYINSNSIKKYNEKDVLVISEPQVTAKMINVVISLATEYPQSDFYFRPHPLEILSPEQEESLKLYKNVHVQDNTINIMEVLYGFNYIIGESSTVLYEAISLGKMVGKIFMMGLNPLYLQPEDKDCFWEIYSLDDFKSFMEGDMSGRKSRCIYSKFNKEKFMCYINRD